LETATRVVCAMVSRFGMSEKIGPVSVLPPEGDLRMTGTSDALLDAVDDEVHHPGRGDPPETFGHFGRSGTFL
jgi:ATP-dependent Zn protease